MTEEKTKICMSCGKQMTPKEALKHQESQLTICFNSPEAAKEFKKSVDTLRGK